jgi:D-alanine transfer protein
MKTPHLLPAATAVLVAGMVLAGGYCYALRVERGAVKTLAVSDFASLVRNRALQAEAFHHAHLLPVYGSSEVILPDPYHVSTLFEKHPTGFLPFPVGQMGDCSLLHTQQLAAVAPDMRGKRVVLSFTGSGFRDLPWRLDEYMGNFSRMNANELAFSTRLSHEVKQTTARRMLTYPRTLEDDPLLRFALERLADDSPFGQVLYLAALPLGKLQTLVLCLQDHWEAVCVIRRQPAAGQPAAVAASGGALDWAALAEEAEGAYRPHTCRNPFGIEDEIWFSKAFHGTAVHAEPGSRDEEFRQELARSREWGDLEMLLRALRELGAKPLLLSTPLHGTYLEYNGVSRPARQRYYNRLEALARSLDVPLVDFADHDLDRFFLCDISHLSSKGWVYYAYALDAFYHGRRWLRLIPDRSATDVTREADSPPALHALR